MHLRSAFETNGWSRRRTLQDLAILTGSFLLFLWVAYEFSLFGQVANRVLDSAKRIDFYETLAAGAFLFCGLWLFALRRANELRAEMHRRAAAEIRAADADFRARHDSLTGLGNRAQFDDDLALLTSGGKPDGRATLLLLDLNGFKTVNDQFGHPFGDEILRITAQRLRSVTRHNKDQLCRLGGDEFAILLDTSGGRPVEAPAERVAEKIIRTIDAPIQLDGRAIQIGVAIGIAHLSSNRTASELVAAADKALYAAKEESRSSGQSRYVVSHNGPAPRSKKASSGTP